MDIGKRLQSLFNPRSVAILGASRTIGKWGFTFLLHLTQGGYKGEIYPVNPAGEELLGRKVSEYVEAALHSDRRGMNFLLDMIELYQKPILLTSEYIVGADRDQNEAVLALRKKNVLIYPSSRRSARVLARLAHYSQ